MDLVTAEPWLMDTQYNASESRNKDLNNPAPTITANRKHHYLMNPQWLNTSPSDVDKPCFTLIARMDKAPPYLVEAEAGQIAIEVYETDTPHMVLIKQFMALYGIVDVKMRMLNVSELLRIQGFPDTYYFSPNATQANKKKFIGNSVVPIISQRLTEANYQANFQEQLLKAV
jgi:DNA (cytosine-5)-methyltransferase 1